MANAVEYIITLRDMLSAKLKEAEGNATQFEKKMDDVKGKLKTVGEFGKEALGALGIGFAVFKGFKTVEEGIHKVHELHSAEAQLKNTMQNMGTYSEEAFEKLVKGAGDSAKGILYSRTEILQMQSQLALVGSVGEKEMARLTQTAADMSTKFGMGLGEAGNMLAKAVNNPEMARRLGMVLKIDPAITQHIQQLAKDGKESEARMELLAVAESKVGGAAKAAFQADPLAGFNKGMASVKMAVGEAAIDLQVALAPALTMIAGLVKDLADGIRGLVGWFKQNQDIVKALAVGIGVATVAWGVYWVATNTAMISTAIMTGGVYLLSGALFILQNVMTFGIPIAIAAVVGAIAYCWERFVGFRAAIMGVISTIKEFGSIVADVFKGVWGVIHGIVTLNPAEIKAGYEQASGAMHDAGMRMATAYKEGHDKVMTDYAKEQEEKKRKKEEEDKKKKAAEAAQMPALAPGAIDTTGGAVKEPGKAKDISAKGATGTKVTTINISIGKLIEQFKIQTTNMTEGTGKVREMVAETLLSALNDSQITAGI